MNANIFVKVVYVVIVNLVHQRRDTPSMRCRISKSGSSATNIPKIYITLAKIAAKIHYGLGRLRPRFRVNLSHVQIYCY